jgi:hypothetical protein
MTHSSDGDDNLHEDDNVPCLPIRSPTSLPYNDQV